MSPDTIDAMLAAGATAEVIAAAWKAELAAQEARAARQIPWAQLRQMAFVRDGEVCGYCGTTEGDFEVDHKVPRAKGGENILENVIVSCVSCNRAKRDREEAEWSGLHARRVKDRERKRKQRDKSRGQRDMSQEVTGHLESPVTPSLDKEIPQTPKETKPTPTPPYSPPASPKRGTRLPEDFEPPEDWIAWAMKKRGWSRSEATDECECFARFWQSKPGREAMKLDWPKTWQNWAVNSRRQRGAEYDREKIRV